MNDGVPKGEGHDALLARLTLTEKRCLELVDQGLQSKEIARVLDRSPNSVDTWLRSASRKLEVRDRFQAAKFFAEATRMAQNGEFSPVSTLRYQDSSIPAAGVSGDREASAGEGSGSDDLIPDRLLGPESSDSGRGRSWLEPSHPLAKFLGGDNPQRAIVNTLLIVGIAILIGIAFSLFVSSYLGFSRILSAP
jgi:DNA-binding CsgD family transcriptional regulator